jgi:hypothetical protein
MLHGGDAGQEEYLLNHIQSNNSNGHHNSNSNSNSSRGSSTQAASERKSDDSDCDMSSERKTIKQEAQNRVVHMLNTSTADVTAAAQSKRVSGSNGSTIGSGSSEAKGAKHNSDNSDQDSDCKGISSSSGSGGDKQRSLLGDLPELDKKVCYPMMLMHAY